MQYTFQSFLISSIFLLVVTSGCQSAVIIDDEFSGSSINSTLWSSDLPFADSSIGQSGGMLTMINRARLYPNESVLNATITGTLQASALDAVKITTRSSLTEVDAIYRELDGLRFEWHFDSQSIAIYQQGGELVLASKSYTLNTGQWYDFTINDSGTNVSWIINGIEELTATTFYSAGTDWQYTIVKNRELLPWLPVLID